MKEVVLAIIGSGAFSAIVSAIVAGTQAKKKKESGMAHGVRQILYMQIKKECKECLRNGCVDADTLEALEESWKIYHHELGGNGFLDALMSKVRALPVTE